MPYPRSLADGSTRAPILPVRLRPPVSTPVHSTTGPILPVGDRPDRNPHAIHSPIKGSTDTAHNPGSSVGSTSTIRRPHPQGPINSGTAANDARHAPQGPYLAPAASGHKAKHHPKPPAKPPAKPKPKPKPKPHPGAKPAPKPVKHPSSSPAPKSAMPSGSFLGALWGDLFPILLIAGAALAGWYLYTHRKG